MALHTRQVARVPSSTLPEHAAHVRFRAGLHEREVTRAEAHRCIRAVKAPRKLAQHALQFGEADPLVDQKPSISVEHRRVRHVVVATKHAAAADDRHRRGVVAHLAYLHVAGVCAQEHACVGLAAVDLHPEAVLHVRGRVVRRKRELGEVVALEFDLGAPRDLETQRAEDVQDLVGHLSDGVVVTALAHSTGRLISNGGALKSAARAARSSALKRASNADSTLPRGRR